MPISNDFRARFMEFVDESEQKYTQISQKMGVPYDIFSKIKNYGIVPSPRILVRIADYFDTSIDFLLAKTDDERFIRARQPQTFQTRLEELKNQKNLTYYALGKMLHINSNYFSDWKTKNYFPSLDYLLLLSDFFDVTLDYLLGRSD